MENIKQLVASCEAAVSGKATREDVKRIVECLMRQAPTDLLAAIASYAWARVEHEKGSKVMVPYSDRLLPFAITMDSALALLGDNISRLRGPEYALSEMSASASWTIAAQELQAKFPEAFDHIHNTLLEREKELRAQA